MTVAAVPLALPVTFPVTFPVNCVDVITPVLGLYVKPVSVSAPCVPVAPSTKTGYTVSSVLLFADAVKPGQFSVDPREGATTFNPLTALGATPTPVPPVIAPSIATAPLISIVVADISISVSPTSPKCPSAF